MGEKAAQQFHRRHCFRDEGGWNEGLGIMLRGIKQELFHVDDPCDLVRRLGIDRDPPVPPFLAEPDRLLVRQIVRQDKSIDPRGHAILRRFVAQLDDFLDHLALRLVQRAFRFAHFNQRFELLVADPRPDAEPGRGEAIDHEGAGMLEHVPDAIEQRHHHLEGENAERADPVGGG